LGGGSPLFLREKDMNDQKLDKACPHCDSRKVKRVKAVEAQKVTTHIAGKEEEVVIGKTVLFRCMKCEAEWMVGVDLL